MLHPFISDQQLEGCKQVSPVQIEEEHDQVETKLDEGLLQHVSHVSHPIQYVSTCLFVHIQFPENLSSIKKMLVVHDPACMSDMPVFHS